MKCQRPPETTVILLHNWGNRQPGDNPLYLRFRRSCFLAYQHWRLFRPMIPSLRVTFEATFSGYGNHWIRES